MDSVWETIGEQIRQARLGAGMSQEVLAERIGLDRTMVAKIEAGRRRVDALELVRFASALDVPIDALLEPQPAVISRRSAPLEDDTATDAGRNSYRINMVLADWLRDVRQLVEAGTLRPTPLMRYPHPVTSEDDARAAARWLRTAHGVGNDPIGSMLEFCERSGQYVLITEVPGDGASLIDGDLAVAVVNHQTVPGRRRATAAHELGHSLSLETSTPAILTYTCPGKIVRASSTRSLQSCCCPPPPSIG